MPTGFEIRNLNKQCFANPNTSNILGLAKSIAPFLFPFKYLQG